MKTQIEVLIDKPVVMIHHNGDSIAQVVGTLQKENYNFYTVGEGRTTSQFFSWDVSYIEDNRIHIGE